MDLAVVVEDPLEAALGTLDAVFSEGVIQASISYDRHYLPWRQRREFWSFAGELDPQPLLFTEPVRIQVLSAFTAIQCLAAILWRGQSPSSSPQ